MDTDDLFTWYEANLPARERKKRGHFSTPSLLVDHILDACGYQFDRDLARIRVLDPACGSGNFLAGAARRLVAFAQHRGLDRSSLIALAQHSLWGFDPDPVACFLADMQLRTVLGFAQQQSRRPRDMRAAPFHIHQADGLALPWQECENVDLFLANPPYLAAKNSDLSGYRRELQRGQVDSYLLFLRLALQVVRPGGWLCLVLPDPVLARANAAIERRRLLDETTVYHLWHFAGVFEAHVGAVVIIARKERAPRFHCISWIREHWQRYQAGQCASQTVPQDLLLCQDRAELRYLLSEVQDPVVARLSEHVVSAGQRDTMDAFVPLSQLVEIRRGEELGKAAALLRAQPARHDQAWYPVLRGGVDVRPYGSPTGNAWIERGDIAKPLERYLVPKLLVVKSTGSLQAALDLQGHVVLQTLYLLRLRESPDIQESIDDLYYLLALLNSRLLKEYVRVLYTAYKWVQPQIEQHVLAQLPIPIASAQVKSSLVQRARALIAACSIAPSVVELELYEEQERVIHTLYDTVLQKRVVEV